MVITAHFTEEQRGSYVKVTFLIKNVYDRNTGPCGESVTLPFHIDGLVDVRFKFVQKLSPSFSTYNNTVTTPILMYVSSKLSDLNIEKEQNNIIKLNVKCSKLNHSNEWLCTRQWTDWIDMGQIAGSTAHGNEYLLEPFDLSMIVSRKESVTFAKLYDDSDLTDFQLSTAEGSIPVHKAFLAAHSDTFRTMFSHEWKETTNGLIKLQGVTLQTLQHLKDYIYLNTLPNVIDALRALLVLASYYFMDNLLSDCITKITGMVTSENLQSLLEYACANNIPELTFALIEQTPSEVVHAAQLNRKPVGVKEDPSD